MGCGASSFGPQPVGTNPTIMISDGHSDLLNNNVNDRKGNLINGILSKKLIKSNSVLPLNHDGDKNKNEVPINHVPDTTSKQADVTTSMSIQENEVPSKVMLIQKVFVKDKHVQCNNLLPEDELEVLMQEDAHINEIRSPSSRKDDHQDNSCVNTINGSDFCESWCQTIVTLQKKLHDDGVSEIGHKEKRKTFSRRTMGGGDDDTSLCNGQRSSEDDVNSELPSPVHVTLSEGGVADNSSLSHLLTPSAILSRDESLCKPNPDSDLREGKKLSSSSSESQTDPMTTAVAATSGGNDPSIASVMIQTLDITSPLSHVERELNCVSRDSKNDCSSSKSSSKKFDEKLQKCLNQLLHDMDSDHDPGLRIGKAVVSKRDVSVQTYNDPITDESPEFAARPPPSRKGEMIPNVSMFKEIDEKVAHATENSVGGSIEALVEHLIEDSPNDLFKVRAIFRWITMNMKYNWNCMGKNYTANELFKSKQGICKDYCILFGEMCKVASIRVKLIQGFAKGFDHKPGYCFKPGKMATTNGDGEAMSDQDDRDLTHNWNAVYILGSWRLIDTTWGTGFTDHSGQFQVKLSEHFFLTDPEVLVWTHFPFDPNESNYSRWQLLEKPLTLAEFNDLPKVTPSFFDFNLKIRSKVTSPITFKIQTEIKVSSHEAMRYKFKLYPADEVENSSLNHFVFCCLKEDRLLGSFTIIPPVEGRFYLKIYAKPEREMLAGQADSSSLHSVVTFHLECIKCRRYLEPFPLNELPWGPTQAFFNYKMKIHNQSGPVILSWGGKRKLVIESVEPMLTTLQLFDSEGTEMDLRSHVMHEEKTTGSGQTFSFTITPPRQGMFKFLVFGMPKPKQKGKWRLPLLASFLVDCKIAKITVKDPNEEDPPPIHTTQSHASTSHYSSTTTSIASSSSSTNQNHGNATNSNHRRVNE